MMQVYPTPGTSFSQSASTSEAVRYQNIDYTNPPTQQLVPRTQWLQFPGARPGASYAGPPNNWPPYELWNVSSTTNTDPSQAQRFILAPPQGQETPQNTLYRIQDILSQGQGHLPGEIAKTPGFQEKSPTGATIYFQDRNGLSDANSYRRKDGQTFGAEQLYSGPIGKISLRGVLKFISRSLQHRRCVLFPIRVREDMLCRVMTRITCPIIPAKTLPTITSIKIMEAPNVQNQQPSTSTSCSSNNLPVLLLCIPSSFQMNEGGSTTTSEGKLFIPYEFH